MPSQPSAMTRRDWLCRAGLGGAGLSLAGLLQARTAAGEHSPAIADTAKIKACILLFYYGGPSHIDTYDMKPDAPANIRGEFQSIATSVPGLRICEHLPGMSKVMHKAALIRSMHHTNRLHDSACIETFTGRQGRNGDREEFAPIEQFFPCHGSTLSYLWRERQLAMPFASLPFVFHNVVDVPAQGAGFLGLAHNPFLVSVDAATGTYGSATIAPRPGLPLARMMERRDLLGRMDGTLPAGQLAIAPPGKHYDKAFQILGSDALHQALDITREETKTRERYGLYPADPRGVAGSHHRGQSLLVARRLVEAGVPFVNVFDYQQQGQNWDAHAKNFEQHKNTLLPPVDRALSALIEDLDQRGLLETTLVVAAGEFGRTPQINASAGRDHWPDCYTILLAGGGVQGGAVYGASDRLGAYPALDPATPADLAATIFWRFGVPPNTEVHDQLGRPFRISEGLPIQSIFA